MVTSLLELGPKEDCAGEAQRNLKSIDHSCQRGCPHNKHATKIINEKEGGKKIGHGPQMVA
jgi:hypothetical protein